MGVSLRVLLLGLAWGATAAASPFEGPRLDAGLLVASPAALGTGLGTGAGAGFTFTGGEGSLLAWGPRLGWSTATEYTATREVSHDDLRLRLDATLQTQIGAGALGLRAGLGGTAVYEERVRAQAERAGLTGDEARSTAWRLLPAADLGVAIDLRLYQAFGFALCAGPAWHLLDGEVKTGWIGEVGLTWRP